jgi:acetyl-CoA acetyltransferase
VRIEGVAVAGVGMVRFGKYPDRRGADLAREAGLAALHDAGMTLADIDEAFVGYIQPASLLGIKAMKELGLTGLPVTHVENASATGLVAFREAAWAVASGRVEVALALAFDKMTEMARGGGPGRGAGRDQIDTTILPAAYFALWAQRRMHDHGTKPEHFAAIAAKNWNHGALCPWSDRRPGPPRDVRRGPGLADGGRAADGDDGLPGRRRCCRRRLGLRRPPAREPGRAPARAAGGDGAADRDLRTRAHVSRAGGRSPHHDP